MAFYEGAIDALWENDMNDEQHQRILAKAWELQHQADEVQESVQKTRDLAKAAQEVGLNPSYVAEAERRMAEEDAALQALEASLREKAAVLRQRRLGLLARGTAAAVAVLAVTWGISSWVEPPPPLVEDFVVASDWGLDISSGTDASLSWVEEAGHGQVAQIRVDQFVAREDGTYFVNLDRHAPYELSEYSTISLQLRGEGLKVARVYLESGDERWRSPAISLTPEWQQHHLPLDAFEHQWRRGGWKVVEAKHPANIATISVKVGHFMNPVEVNGTVWVDELRVE